MGTRIKLLCILSGLLVGPCLSLSTVEPTGEITSTELYLPSNMTSENNTENAAVQTQIGEQATTSIADGGLTEVADTTRDSTNQESGESATNSVNSGSNSVTSASNSNTQRSNSVTSGSDSTTSVSKTDPVHGNGSASNTNAPETATTKVADTTRPDTEGRPISSNEEILSTSRVTAENFKSVRHELDSDLPPSEIAKIQDEVLQSASNVRALTSNTFTPGQRAMLRNQLTRVIEKMIADDNLDIDLIAAGGGQVGSEVIEKLTGNQIEEVLIRGSQQYGLCGRDVTCAQNYAQKMASLGTFTNKPELLGKAANIIGHLSPAALNQAIVHATLDVTYIQNIFSRVSLSREQARLVFEKFNTDSDFGDAVAVQPVAEYSKIPSSILIGVRAEDLVMVADDIAASLYDVFQWAQAGEEVGMVMNQRLLVNSPPLTTLLAAKAKRLGLSSLPLNTVKALVGDGQLSSADIIRDKVTVCKITRADIDRETPPAYTPLGCVVAETCKETWGAVDTTTLYTTYGALAGCATSAELGRLRTESQAFVWSVGNICKGSFNMPLSKLQKVAELVAARLDSAAGKDDLTNGDYIRDYACVLPLVDSIVERLNNLSAGPKQTVCSILKCTDMSKLEDSQARAITEFCLKNGGPLRSMVCLGSGRGGISLPYMAFLRADDIGAHVTCAKVRSAVDLLSISVLDCNARRKILECGRQEANSLNNATSLALFGPLCEFYTLEDWSDVSDATTCGLLDHIPRLFESLDLLSDYRKLQGGFDQIRCDAAGRSRCIQNIRSCATASSARRRRATVAANLTCDEIKRLGQSVADLPSDSLSQLSDAEFEACVSMLGKVAAFTASHWTKLASMAKKIWGLPSTWTSDEIAVAGGIASGLTAAEVDTLVFDDLDAIAALGAHGLWDRDKLGKAFAGVKRDYRENNASLFTESDLKVMGDLACGATTADIKLISSAVYCGAASNLGTLETCETTQLVEWAAHAKVCHGLDVAAWTPALVADLGAVIGGLGKDDLQKLSSAAVSMIKPYSIGSIPTENINGFTAAQLSAMDANQANSFTPDQLDSLDVEKRDAIREKASVAGREPEETEQKNGVQARC